ncbi:2-oxoglutarate and iron-dependent oxygenase domain-containing protein CP2-like [Nicotiana tabacum]|uniref:2-oxoglutarate and iron-dependent oxygenase domain-containing protein CP2-like n=1 Tax=Nicotiana tabacum TaxID=4097 RepID=A0AC58SUG9_TOBAC
MDQRREAQANEINGSQSNENDGVSSKGPALRLYPCVEQKAENYEDLEEELEFSPHLYSALERHLPSSVLSSSRDNKVQYMTDILLRYSPRADRSRLQKHGEYRQKIISNYQPLHRVLYTMHAADFFVPSFIKAISENKEESFRKIMSEPSPGVFTFEMLQPRFCEMMLAEVQNFEKWVRETKFRIMRPNTMNKFGVVLDDFGLQNMLKKFMEDFIRPISTVFFTEVGGSTLDGHHGFVVEYGTDRDIDLGFHVDDAEVTLNVCLGKQFTGGELFFRGVRCEKHVNSDTQPDVFINRFFQQEIFDYVHVAGRAILHCGRHRHGARATTYGQRINLLIWCRSSVFRETRKYQTDFPSWCAECKREKEERIRQKASILKSELRLRTV